ncbi:MAG: dihydrodipicolinate synthase family protein [Luteitalea sp.]|nr:dihydrodipicolinate synthase family protein [Luteitalea sp.]
METSLPDLRGRLLDGLVIPAHPLALNVHRRLDERRQAALTRYYRASGAGGLAVAVHTTQFAIRDAKVGLLEPVLALAAEIAREPSVDRSPPVLVAGICGDENQATREAGLARRLGYDAGLVSLAALRDVPTHRLIAHCRAIAEIIPVFGFYLQPAVGGRLLDYEFWRAFLDIEQVVAIKVAPFNRYHTLDVVRALADSKRQEEVALYTGNDDNIVVDLLADHLVGTGDGSVRIRFAGGLLGQWAVWTKRAVELLQVIKACRAQHGSGAHQLLAQAAALTDANAALFDARHDFAGCIAGLHEILRRQGLLAGRWCLDPDEDLSPGQLEEIDRVCRAYPQLQDDDFVAAQLSEWLRC